MLLVLVSFWDNIVASFTGNPSVFTGNPSVFTGNHLPETICVYQFGPGVTQQKADAWCGQFKGGQNSTCWQPQWHQIVVLSRSHHCTSRTLSLIHKVFFVTYNTPNLGTSQQNCTNLKDLLFLFRWEEVLGWALFCSPAAAPAMADA